MTARKGDIERAFRAWLRSARDEPLRGPLPPGVTSLAHIGLPRLFTVHAAPAVAVREGWERSRVLPFPERCSACERPATVHTTLSRARGWLRSAEVLLERCIPQCDRHAPLGPCFWLEATPLGRDVAWDMVAPSPEFLKDAKRLCEAGDHLPPWKAFPEYEPETSGWRQGPGEYWLHSSWSPFWSSLEAEAQRSYLARWPPPAAWAESLGGGWGSATG